MYDTHVTTGNKYWKVIPCVNWIFAFSFRPLFWLVSSSIKGRRGFYGVAANICSPLTGLCVLKKLSSLEVLKVYCYTIIECSSIVPASWRSGSDIHWIPSSYWPFFQNLWQRHDTNLEDWRAWSRIVLHFSNVYRSAHVGFFFFYSNLFTPWDLRSIYLTQPSGCPEDFKPKPSWITVFQNDLKNSHTSRLTSNCSKFWQLKWPYFDIK